MNLDEMMAAARRYATARARRAVVANGRGNPKETEANTEARVRKAEAELQAELSKLAAERNEILKALRDAHAHLDWIGWGDGYERSCAEESGTMRSIEDVVNKYEGT